MVLQELQICCIFICLGVRWFYDNLGYFHWIISLNVIFQHKNKAAIWVIKVAAVQKAVHGKDSTMSENTLRLKYISNHKNFLEQFNREI